MITENQREALAVLTELCKLSDDIRLGQLIAWLGDMGEIESGHKLADIDDDQLLAVMHQHRANLLARLPESQRQAFESNNSSAVVGKP